MKFNYFRLFWPLYLFLIVIAVISFFSGCKPVRYLDKHHDEICAKCIDEYSKIGKDSATIRIDTIIMPGEGQTNDLYQMLLLECDSVGNVTIKTLFEARDSANKLKSDVNVLNRVISSFYIKNNMLFSNIKVLNDSIKYLNKIIELNKAPVIIEKPAQIVYKVPVIWHISIYSLIFILGMFVFLYISKLLHR